MIGDALPATQVTDIILVFEVFRVNVDTLDSKTAVTPFKLDLVWFTLTVLPLFNATFQPMKSVEGSSVQVIVLDSPTLKKIGSLGCTLTAKNIW